MIEFTIEWKTRWLINQMREQAKVNKYLNESKIKSSNN